MSNLIFKNIKDPKQYQDFLVKNSAPFTQSEFYGLWHQHESRRVKNFSIENKQGEVFLFMQLIRLSAPFGQSLWYSPYGPVIKKEKLKDLIPILKAGLKKEIKNGIFIRLDFHPLLDQKEKEFVGKEFQKSDIKTYKGSIFQPRDEWVLSLGISEEELFKNIHKKNRYCIRQAQEREVKIEIITENLNEHFQNFYKLLETTSKRNNFSIHNKSYYQRVFETINTNKNGYLVNSKIDGEIGDSLLFINFGKTVMFIFGGSDDKNRDIPSAHLAQWESIKYAKKNGFKFYNFGGISTDENPIKSLESVTRFKKRFGGQILKHSDFYDLVNNKLMYFLYVLKKRFFK